MTWFRRENKDAAKFLAAVGAGSAGSASCRPRFFEAELLRSGVYPFTADELGKQLGTDRRFQMLVHSSVLKTSAPFFSGVPIVPAHDREDRWLGLVARARYDGIAQSINCEVAIWDNDAISGIDAGDLTAVSPWFRGPHVMRPGRTRDGQAFDGYFDFFGGIHVALVPASRGTGKIGAEVNFDVALEG